MDGGTRIYACSLSAIPSHRNRVRQALSPPHYYSAHEVLSSRSFLPQGRVMTDPITRLNAALEGRYRIERQLGEGGMTENAGQLAERLGVSTRWVFNAWPARPAAH